ncbi:MAG: DUF1640 domain-containing protein [Magnetococcales bacterium]|nr:DUF1640 domain-containing protein [Magnetococcales bacterium]MBF0420114.1 DUF1640 domain-containing protein [Magnetococcales bacterium]
MSTTIAFDTHAYVKKLRDAGVDEHQAEIQAEAILALVEERLATKQDMHALQRDLADVEADLKRDLAEIRKDMGTIEANLKQDLANMESNLRKDMASIESNLKRDIKELESNLKRDIKELDTKTETRFKELELRMVIKMGAMILGGIGLVFGLMRAWPLPVQYVPFPATQEKNIPAPPLPLAPSAPATIPATR